MKLPPTISSLYLKLAKISRKEMAKSLGIAYSTLSNRLDGFNAWPKGEMERAQKIVAMILEQREKEGDGS